MTQPTPTETVMKLPGIGPVLSEARKRLGMTVPAFAERVGRHTTTVSRIEKGERDIDLDELDEWQKRLADPRYKTLAIVTEYLGRRYSGFSST